MSIDVVATMGSELRVTFSDLRITPQVMLDFKRRAIALGKSAEDHLADMILKEASASNSAENGGDQ